MTMTDGERAIVAQLKNIARALGVDPDDEQSFADTTKRFAEGGALRAVPIFNNPIYRTGTHEGEVPLMDADRAVKRYGVTTDEGTRITVEVPTESSNRVWERIMRDGEGDHLLNPAGDHTGEDVD